jgi:hypothetical protein
MSWYRGLYYLQWCVSWFKAKTNLSGQPTVALQKIKKKRKVRAHTQHLVFARLAFTSPSKKHDKQLTFIVRVSTCINVKLSLKEESIPVDLNQS